MYYVYGLIDPRSNTYFYIGKGHGRRAQTHLWGISRITNQYKESIIAAIRRDGLEPQIEIIHEDIVDEEEAYRLEEALILQYGRKGYETGGILANVNLGGKPPCVRGMTYEQIYGDKADEQREKRRARQIAAGGYGPKKHSMETRAKLSEMRKGKKTGRTTEGHSTRSGPAPELVTSRFVITSPNGESHTVFGNTDLKSFCTANNLSYATFVIVNLRNGCGVSKKGKNKGWTIEEYGVKTMLRVTYPDGHTEEFQGDYDDFHRIAEQREWPNYWSHKKGIVKTKGSLRGMKFEIILLETQEARPQRRTLKNPNSNATETVEQRFVVTSPSGEKNTFWGYAALSEFCSANGLSLNNFVRFLKNGSHPPIVRKNIGWSIEQFKVKRTLRVTYADGSVEDIVADDPKKVAQERGWHESWRRNKGEVKTDGPLVGMKFEIILE